MLERLLRWLRISTVFSLTAVTVFTLPPEFALLCAFFLLLALLLDAPVEHRLVFMLIYVAYFTAGVLYTGELSGGLPAPTGGIGVARVQ